MLFCGAHVKDRQRVRVEDRADDGGEEEPMTSGWGGQRVMMVRRQDVVALERHLRGCTTSPRLESGSECAQGGKRACVNS